MDEAAETFDAKNVVASAFRLNSSLQNVEFAFDGELWEMEAVELNVKRGGPYSFKRLPPCGRIF